MAISWGSYNGHLRVGIDHSISPANPSHSDTTVKVTWTWYVGTDGWNFSGDNSTMREDCDGWGGTNDAFTNNLTSGHMKVGSHTETYSISYNSGSKSASGSLSGAYNGAHPSHSVSVNLPDRPIAAPSAGEAVQCDSTTTTSADLSWGAPNDNGGGTVDQYQLQVSRSSGFSSSDIDYDSTFNGTGSDSRTATGLSPNTHYYARVRAHNSAGWGDWTSSTYCQFTTDGGVPSAPGGLVRTNRTTTSITMAWNSVSNNGGGALTYDAECYSDSGLTTLVQSATGLTTTSYQFTGLSPSTTYYFRVRASNADFGAGSWSGTDPEATKAVTVYTDEGDYVTLVNNLANAIGDKLVHLGIYTERCHTNTITLPHATSVSFNMGTFVSDQGPDQPTYLGSGTNDIQINYPGLYLIEFTVWWGYNDGGGHGTQQIFINGSNSGNSSTDPKHGHQEYIDLGAPSGSSTAGTKVTMVVRLEVGDTIGWQLWQNSGVSQNLNHSSDAQASCKVALVGF